MALRTLGGTSTTPVSGAKQHQQHDPYRMRTNMVVACAVLIDIVLRPTGNKILPKLSNARIHTKLMRSNLWVA